MAIVFCHNRLLHVKLAVYEWCPGASGGMLGTWLLWSTMYQRISKGKGGRQLFLELMLFMPEIELSSPWERGVLMYTRPIQQKTWWQTKQNQSILETGIQFVPNSANTLPAKAAGREFM